MRQLLEVQQEVRDPQEFLQNLKIDLYPEEVYIFTPKGEVRSLPRGATAVDFAYSIHTDVGHQCVGSRVNGKMVPLRTRLQNGDIVAIMTQSGHKPSRDWLTFVVTSRARNKIKHVLQGEERVRSVDHRTPPVREGGAALRSQSEEGARERGAREIRGGVRRAEIRRAAGAHRLWEDPRRAPCCRNPVPRRTAQGAASGLGGRLGRQARAAAGRHERQDQGARHRRHHGVPRQVLQPDPRGKDCRLHHAGQGRLRPLLQLSQRAEPDVRP